LYFAALTQGCFFGLSEIFSVSLKALKWGFPRIYQRLRDMAVPKSKITRSRRGNRRSHDSLVAGNPNECANCGELKRPHHVCSACGHYDDRQVISVADDIETDDDAAWKCSWADL